MYFTMHKDFSNILCPVYCDVDLWRSEWFKQAPHMCLVRFRFGVFGGQDKTLSYLRKAVAVREAHNWH